MKIAVFINGSSLWLTEIPKILIDVPIVPNILDYLHLTDAQQEKLANKIWRITNPEDLSGDCEFRDCFYGHSNPYDKNHPHREDLSLEDFRHVIIRIVDMNYLEKGIDMLIGLSHKPKKRK